MSTDPASDQTRIHATLASMAVPRLCGSDGWMRVTRHVRHTLEALDFTVSEQRFVFSEWPARYGVPLVGVLVALSMAGVWSALDSGRPAVALLALLLVQALVALLFIAAERFLLRLPWGRRDGVNLFARSGPERPRILVVAHRDSKSQPVPIALRVMAATIAGFAWMVLLASACSALIGGRAFLVAPAALAGIVAGLILIACTTGNASPGALDNATGVTALLDIAARMHGRADVAFLVTDAEEFGMAGASAAAGPFAYLDGVLNLDGLDDPGPFHLLSRYGTPRRGGAPRLEHALLAAARETGEPARSRAVPRGLMLDHIAFARAGVPAVTIMRGTLRAMARVHRPADRADRIRGTGVAATVRLVCRALELLRPA